MQIKKGLLRGWLASRDDAAGFVGAIRGTARHSESNSWEGQSDRVRLLRASTIRPPSEEPELTYATNDQAGKLETNEQFKREEIPIRYPGSLGSGEQHRQKSQPHRNDVEHTH